MNTTTKEKHTPWNDSIMFTGMTGPTTPASTGVTVEESLELKEWERAGGYGKKIKRPAPRHTAIGFGATVVAIAVGENHPARAAFIVRACNSHDALVARVAALEGALRNSVAHFDYISSGLAQGHTVSISSVQNCSAIARAALNTRGAK